MTTGLGLKVRFVSDNVTQSSGAECTAVCSSGQVSIQTEDNKIQSSAHKSGVQ